MRKYIKNHFWVLFLGFVLLGSYLYIGNYFLTNINHVLDSLNNTANESFTFVDAILVEIFVTIFYCFAVFAPMARKSDNYDNTFKRLFLIRFFILIIGNLFYPLATIIVDFVAVFFFAFIASVSGDKNITNVKIEDLPKEFFATYGITNVEKFKEDLVFQYINVMFASNDYDYDMLQKLCSKGKYAIIKGALKSHENKGVHRIIDEIDIYDAKIYKYELTKDKILLYMNISASYLDYMKQNDRVIYGSSRTPNLYAIDLVFERAIDSRTTSLNYCEECGAEVKDKKERFCQECGASLKKDRQEWLLKENIILFKQ